MVARAFLVALPLGGGLGADQCCCVELVGNRFLRRMIRNLVVRVEGGDAHLHLALDVYHPALDVNTFWSHIH